MVSGFLYLFPEELAMLHRSSLSDVPVYLTMPEPPVTLANKSDSEQIFARQLELIFFKERRSSAKPHNLVKESLLGLILLHLLGYHQELFHDLPSLKKSHLLRNHVSQEILVIEEDLQTWTGPRCKYIT